MANYYSYIKDEKLKKLIRAQRIIMWIPLVGSAAAIGMMQFILYKKQPEKIFKFDAVLIAAVIGLIGLYLLMRFVFPNVLPKGFESVIYITALVFVSYFAAFIGVQDEIKTVYELQEGIIKAEPEESGDEKAGAKALRKAEAARNREAVRSLEAARKAETAQRIKAGSAEGSVQSVQSVATNDKIERAEGDTSVLPPVIEQAHVARMIRDDTEKTLRAKLPKRTKNIIGHEEKVLRTLKVYMTPEREAVLSSVGTTVDYTLLWIINDDKTRRAEVLYSRPVLKKGYTCYFSLTINRGGNKNGMLFKLSEITNGGFIGASHRKYYQTEEIIKTVGEYLE